ncbi:hypothetical protein AK830_g5195 [Neonectria ditissima]|uniref:Protein kinase domain-containing protein n=1 Tax=Neonectria ditissima TaxID=78410 RepID=A0A0P7BLF6_9HYPO|nr:hypothetical protein AK830_g5195 [Neonectria ditissima]
MQHQAEPRPSRLPDLVRDSQLATRFLGAGATKHTIYVTPSQSTRRSRVRAEQIWQRERKLGNGTFGHVWLERCASGPTSGSVRAVKEMPKDSSLPVNYLRELEAMAKFSHEKYVHCFVKCFGWYMSESMVFIAMEHLEHGDLQKHLHQPFPEEQAKDIISQLTEGLMYMHDNGFAHRDLKPANILVYHPSPNWWVKIGDFGISKRAEEGNTALRTLIGTEGYLAPEVLGFVFDKDAEASGSDAFSYTFAVDIWALGELTFRMITKAPAFPNRQDLFNCVVRGYPFPVSVLEAAGATPSCCDFVIKSMVGDPSKRMTARDASTHEWIRASRPSSASSSRSSQVMSQITTATSNTSVDRNTNSFGTLSLSDPTFQYESTAQWSTGVPGSRLVQTEPQQTATGQDTQKVTEEKPSSAPTTNQSHGFQPTADWTAVPRTPTPMQPKYSFMEASKERVEILLEMSAELARNAATEGKKVQDSPGLSTSKAPASSQLSSKTPEPSAARENNRAGADKVFEAIPWVPPVKDQTASPAKPPESTPNWRDHWLEIAGTKEERRGRLVHRAWKKYTGSGAGLPAATASKPTASPATSEEPTVKPSAAQKLRWGSKEYKDIMYGDDLDLKSKLIRQLDGIGEPTIENPESPSPPATPVSEISPEAKAPEEVKTEANPSAASSSKTPASDAWAPTYMKRFHKSNPADDPLGIRSMAPILDQETWLRNQEIINKKHEATLREQEARIRKQKAEFKSQEETLAKIRAEARKSENRKIEFVTALFSYVAQAKGDLNFEKGDVVRVLERTEIDNDWWNGELNGEQGLFPANYCTPVTVISTTVAPDGAKMPRCFLHKEVKSAYTSLAVGVEFVNRTKSGIKTLWIKWDGSPVYYTTISPGRTVKQPTYVDHVWRLVDATTGEVRAVYTAPHQASDTVVIQDPEEVSVPRSRRAQQHPAMELEPPAVPDIHSFTSVIESFEEDDDGNIKFACTKFVVVDKGNRSVWAGSLDIPRTRVKIQQAIDCLRLVAEDLIYPLSSPDMPLTAASDYTLEEDLWLKRPDITIYSQVADSTVIAEEFLDEIRAHQIIQKSPHPNLVEFKGCLEKNGRVVGVLLKRYVVSLSARVKGRNHTPFDRTSCFEGIQAGVNHLHSLGLAHNDINPENIMLDDQDRPVIINMGSCKRLGEDLYQIGTPGWNDGFEEVSSKSNDEIGLQKIMQWILTVKGRVLGLKEALEKNSSK